MWRYEANRSLKLTLPGFLIATALLPYCARWFNEFVQWTSFGSDNFIAENVRDEQRKVIKYNHLVANILAFHNIVSMTKAIDQLTNARTW